MKKNVLMVLCALLVIGQSVYAYDFSAVSPSGQTLYYKIVDGHAEVVHKGWDNAHNAYFSNYVTGDLVIPSEVIYNNNTYAVTALAYYSNIGAFEDCDITSISIPSSITTIGAYCFDGCDNLSSVSYLGTIAQWCNISFYSAISTLHSLNINGNPITELVIPEGVTYVKNFSFAGCIGLTSVSFPSSVIQICQSAFEGCSNLISVSIPSNVTSIGQSAFKDCSSLTSVSIPSSVSSIGYFAFMNCSSLISVTIPSSITSIGMSAFYGCGNLTSFNYSGSVMQWCNISFASPLNQGTPYSLTINGSLVTELVIPEGVTNIKDYSFNGCSSLVFVSVPSSVTSIGINTFSGCDNLSVIRLKPAVPPTISEYCVLCDSIIDIVVPRNSYEVYSSAGSNYTRHHIYRDSVFVSIAVNDTARGYTNDTVLLYQHPDTLEVVATPYYGYHFAHWDNNTTDSVRRITNITQDITATAYFDKNRYTVQITSDTIIHGSFHPSWLSWNRRVDEINDQHDYLAEFSVDVCPYPGYHFTHWQDGDTNNPRTFIVTEDAQYVAYYAKNTYTLTFQSDNETMGIVNTTAVSGEYLDSTMLIYATAMPHYHFVHWSDNNIDNPRRFVFDDNHTYTAYFAIDVHTVSVHADNLAQGSVSGTGCRDYGQPITVSATPYSGYQFSHWSDGSTYNPYTFAVVDDVQLTAYFYASGTPYQDTIYLDTLIIHETEYVHDTVYLNANISDTCAITEFPYTMDFNSGASCWWLGDHNNDGITWGLVNGYGVDSSVCAYVQYAVNSDDWFLSPWIVMYGTFTVSWKAKVMSANYPETYQVLKLRADNSYEIIFDETLTSTTYVDRSANFSIQVGSLERLVFRYISNDQYVLFIDDVVINQGNTYYYHDTTYINVPYAVHDTTIVTLTDTVTVTEYVPVHDTTVVTWTDTVINTVYDTVVNTVYDTVDNYIYDTVTNTIYDTVINTVYDTIDNYIHDTTIVTDTLWLTEYDTIYITDTIIIHDTVYVTEEGIDDVQTANIRLYQRGVSIVVEDADGGILPEVAVYDAVGRRLSGERRVGSGEFEMPVSASGVYIVKVGDRPARRVVVVK